ncbi:hypothetical protein FHX74_000078 [Friedmanniella endophytica]|uniref:Uncharacterized protein n=1 Tax=Microlunatus kandeliicorticis TaxID=1759536 RepID=A0A7W3INT0_9ACTN|nr:hypothetical protein [Microlunatus kandeliicorticis]MBA8792484.1 hypothetical protein [Microlunatus kandeliicorticis]
MPTYRVRPSKPVALITSVLGVAIVAFGVYSMVHRGQMHGFAYLWLVFGVVIIGFNLWSAFSSRGGTQVITRDDDPTPRR